METAGWCGLSTDTGRPLRFTSARQGVAGEGPRAEGRHEAVEMVEEVEVPVVEEVVSTRGQYPVSPQRFPGSR